MNWWRIGFGIVWIVLGELAASGGNEAGPYVTAAGIIVVGMGL